MVPSRGDCAPNIRSSCSVRRLRAESGQRNGEIGSCRGLGGIGIALSLVMRTWVGLGRVLGSLRELMRVVERFGLESGSSDKRFRPLDLYRFFERGFPVFGGSFAVVG